MIKYLSILFLSFDVLCVNAQKIYIGVGVNSSASSYSAVTIPNITFNTSKYTEDVFDLNIMFEFYIKKPLSVKTGILHHKISLGYSYTIDLGNQLQRTYYQYHATYIDVPVLLSYSKSDKKGLFNINFSAGSYLGIGSGGETMMIIGKHQGIEGFPASVFRKTNLGIYLSSGIGYKKWVINGYYMKPLTPIISNSSIITSASSHVYGLNLIRILDLSKKNPD